MKDKKDGFFKKVWTSIQNFEGYQNFAMEKATKAIKYLLLISLIFTIIIAALYTYKLKTSVGKIRDYIDKNIEEVSMIDRRIINKTRK